MQKVIIKSCDGASSRTLPWLTAVSCRPQAWPANSCQLSTQSMAGKPQSAVYHKHGRRTAVNPSTTNVRDHSVFRVLRIGIPGTGYLRPLQGEGVTIILLIELVQEHCLGSWWTDVVNTLHSSLFWPWCSESVPSFEDRYTGTGTLAFTRRRSHNYSTAWACSRTLSWQLVESCCGCCCQHLAWQLSGRVLFWPWCWERGNPLGQPAASPNSTGLSVVRKDLFHGFRIYSIYRYRYWRNPKNEEEHKEEGKLEKEKRAGRRQREVKQKKEMKETKMEEEEGDRGKRRKRKKSRTRKNENWKRKNHCKWRKKRWKRKKGS